MTRLSHEEKMEQDLLLLAHGALSFGPRLRLLPHLRRCPACRARLAELTQASLRLASAVRGPELPAWSHADAVARAAPPARRLVLPALLGLVAVLAVMSCWVAWTAFAPAPHPVMPVAIAVCRPDLPNSRCR